MEKPQLTDGQKTFIEFDCALEAVGVCLDRVLLALSLGLDSLDSLEAPFAKAGSVVTNRNPVYTELVKIFRVTLKDKEEMRRLLESVSIRLANNELNHKAVTEAVQMIASSTNALKEKTLSGVKGVYARIPLEEGVLSRIVENIVIRLNASTPTRAEEAEAGTMASRLAEHNFVA